MKSTTLLSTDVSLFPTNRMKSFPFLVCSEVQRSKSDIARLWADVSISISLMSSLFAKRENKKGERLNFLFIDFMLPWAELLAMKSNSTFDRSCREEKIQSESQLNCFNCWFTVPSSTEDAIEKMREKKLHNVNFNFSKLRELLASTTTMIAFL